MEKRKTQSVSQRVTAAILAVAMLLALMPAVELPAAAADPWAQDYLDTLVSWGVMRGDIDGNLYPDRQITRAEYVTMINRAFGYTVPGSIPFNDVLPSAWYYDDIAIAYRVGYFRGTGDTTASPEASLTREEAVVMLGRNLMYRVQSGEVLGFSDSREFSEWSRGLIQVASEMGVVSGYEDGTFRPHSNITRGEVATILVRAIGNLLNTPGEHTLGSVYGNVTISSSGMQLKNTVIAGDLYLTGGVDLGDVLLENVTVLGRIVASGAGESNKGENSIILRNVSADQMVVDSIQNQFVTIRAEGDTDITSVSVRTDGYLEDATRNGAGLRYIELDGEDGIELQLAGNIKEVLNLTPESSLIMAQGSAERVTIDELAIGAEMVIENGARVKELNLDVATSVTGSGDIEHLTVNASGSSVSMLPDTITIRPGITADVGGETMDNTAAAESSEDPRLLAGYPAARNIAPTSAEAVFSTNKRATVYWAVSALTDGSVSEADLISPPSYSGKILRNGSVSVNSSSTEVTARITGLTSDGSYYLSAVMVDSRGQRSPVKVSAFTTPDNSVPQFASGYPYMSRVGNDSAQVAVMPTKTCQLYYAVLPSGSTAPTVTDFRTGSISGHLGYGSVDVTKNVADAFTVNSQALNELTSYDLYLCLIDADGGQNSGVRKLTFTTIDGTPPVFLTEPTVNNIQATSVGLLANLNEAGTIYWVVVAHNEEYPKPLAGQTTKPALSSETAKMQVEYGMNALRSGSVRATANRDVTITVTGLTEQTAYDFYYVAKDTAGNYSETVKMVTINTLDTVPPTVSQSFTRTADADGAEPMSDTDVEIIFSEGVQDSETNQIFLELYTEAQGGSEEAAETLYGLLRDNFTLWDASTRPYTQVGEKSEVGTDAAAWIDYHNVGVRMENGQTIFTFYNAAGDNAARGGQDGGGNIKLSSGGTYYFEVRDIEDTSNNTNLIRPNPQTLPQFTTVFAQVDLTSNNSGDGPVVGGQDVRIDMRFEMHPRSTQNVDSSVYYDLFLWSDRIIRFDLYARIKDEQGNTVTATDAMFEGGTYAQDDRGWIKVNSSEISLTPDIASGERVGTSVRRAVVGSGVAGESFPLLNTLNEDYTYEYAISLTQVGELTNYETWSDRVTIGVTIPAGPERNIGNLANNITVDSWNASLSLGLSGGGVRQVGSPEDFEVFRQFTDTQVPVFTGGYPTFDAGDAMVTMNVQLDRPGTLYYVLAPMYSIGDDQTLSPLNSLQTLNENGQQVVLTDLNDTTVPTDGSQGSAEDHYGGPTLSAPTNITIYNPNFSNSRIKTGSRALQTGIDEITVDGLQQNTVYYVYFVLRGQSQNMSPVYLFRFATLPVETPVLSLYDDSPSVDVETTTPSEVYWILYANDDLASVFNNSFYDYIKTDVYPESADGETYRDYFRDNWEKIFPDLTGSGADHQTPRVIDALLASVDGEGTHSVFDEYANTRLINTVLDNIRTGSGANSGAAGNGTVQVTNQMAANSYRSSVDCTQYMSPEARYYFIAAARNVQGQQYSFKAIRNIQIPDREPPEYQAHQTTTTTARDRYTGATIQGSWMTAGVDELVGYMYEGSVTINFTEALYWLDPSDERTLTPITADNIEDYVQCSAGIQITAEPEQVGSNIRLNFTNAVHGATITFFGSGFISDASSNTTPKKLTLTFDVTMSNKDTDPDAVITLANPGFRATWQ